MTPSRKQILSKVWGLDQNEGVWVQEETNQTERKNSTHGSRVHKGFKWVPYTILWVMSSSGVCLLRVALLTLQNGDTLKEKAKQFSQKNRVYLGISEELQFRTSKQWQAIGKSGEQRRRAFFHRGKGEVGRYFEQKFLGRNENPNPASHWLQAGELAVAGWRGNLPSCWNEWYMNDGSSNMASRLQFWVRFP